MTQFEDLEASAIAALTNADYHADKTANTLEEMNKIQFNTVGEAFRGIGRNILIGVFQPMINNALPIINKFGNWINDNMPVIEAVSKKTFDVIAKSIDVVYTFVKDQIIPVFTNLFNNTNEQFPWIKEVVKDFFATAKDYALSLWQFFNDSLLPIYEDMYKWIKTKMPMIRQVMQVVFEQILKVIQAVWSFIKSDLLPIMASFYENVREHLPQIQKIFENVFGIVAGVIKIVWDLLESSLIPVIVFLWEKVVRPLLPKVGKLVEETFNGIIWVVEKTTEAFKTIVTWIQKAIDLLTFWNNTPAHNKQVSVDYNDGYTSDDGTPIRRYAAGTNYHPGGIALLGEEGPELVNLPKGSKVATADKTRQLLSSDEGTTIINLNLNEAMIMDDYGVDRMMDRVIERLSLKGVRV